MLRRAVPPQAATPPHARHIEPKSLRRAAGVGRVGNALVSCKASPMVSRVSNARLVLMRLQHMGCATRTTHLQYFSVTI